MAPAQRLSSLGCTLHGAGRPSKGGRLGLGLQSAARLLQSSCPSLHGQGPLGRIALTWGCMVLTSGELLMEAAWHKGEFMSSSRGPIFATKWGNSCDHNQQDASADSCMTTEAGLGLVSRQTGGT